VAWVVSVFGFSDFGSSVPAALLGKLVVMACCLGSSISGACRRTRRTPSGETVRKALIANLSGELPELEGRINEGLGQLLPRAFFKRPRRLAIDLHQRPYYGRRERTPVRGGKPKAGTKWFWTWATVAVVDRGQRWTIAMTHVTRNDPLEEVLARLLDCVEKAEIPVKMVLVDREFYAAKVISLLQGRKLPFLMPAIRRGQTKGPGGLTGTQPFFQPGVQGFFEHEWTARGKSNGQRVKVQIACVARKPGDRRKRPLVFAFDGLTSRQLEWYRETYRKRFGIETSYRQLGEGLANTTSKSPAWRMLLVGVALLMRNLWVWRNQAIRPHRITLSEQLHQLNIYLSHDLDLILDFAMTNTLTQT
jgi:putative transposase